MAKRWHGRESRWGDRVDVNIPVHVSRTNVWVASGCMRNLSLSGALVNSDTDLELNSLVEVSIPIPAETRRSPAVKAYVCRKLKTGVAVEWCEFAPAVVKDLLRHAPGLPAW